MNTRSLGLAFVFVAGCAVGGASARFVVPRANAQQAATLTKWDYVCFDETDGDAKSIETKAKQAGAQGWEMAGFYTIPRVSTWCFKRPKM